MKDKLKELIDNNDVISFDIFDTLLFRNVFKPTDIFKIIEKKVYEKYNVENFYNIRIKCEIDSRKKVSNGESNYNEIYNEISSQLGSEVAEFAKKIELELELEFIDVNPFMKDIFDYALKNKKTIYLISDMYLSKDFIYKLLDKAKYKRVPLYVSCEHRAGKGNIKLFEIVLEENKIDKTKWLHIGDNKVSDYDKPMEFGINAYNYKNIREYDKKNPNSIEESIITAIQNNYLYNGNDIGYWEAFGVKNIYPIYFGFTFWLYNITKTKDNLFFLARDGYIIKKIYDLFPKNNTYTDYIYCSRKSVQIPALIKSGEDYMLNMLTLKNKVIKEKITLKNILKKVDLEPKTEYLDIFKQFGFNSFDDELNVDNERNMFKAIAVILDDIKIKLKKDADLAIKYLNQEGMDKFDTINVMDIGWGGSIQYSIRSLLEKRVVGYYFGTNYTSDKPNLFTSTFGYYFDLDNSNADMHDIIDNVMMYEFIFTAPHGTTLQYEKVKNKIVPVLDEEANIGVVSKFQNASLEVIEKTINYLEYFSSIDKYFCLNNYKKFINDKNIEDMRMFSNIQNDFVLGFKEKFNYVQTFTLEEIKKDYKGFVSKKALSIWKDAYIIIDGSEREINRIIKRDRFETNIKKNIKKIGKKIIPFKIRKKILDKIDKMKKN